MPSLGHRGTEGGPSKEAEALRVVVRQEVQNEMRGLLDELKGFGRELGESLDRFMCRVESQRGQWEQQSNMDDKQMGQEDGAEDAAMVVASATSPTKDDKNSFKIITEHRSIEDMMSGMALIDLSSRPNSGSEAPTIVYARQVLHDFDVRFDGTNERLVGALDVHLVWAETRMPRLDKDDRLTAQIPKGIWVPLRSGSCSTTVLPTMSLGLEDAKISLPSFSFRDNELPPTEGLWLDQSIKNIKFDVVVDHSSLQTFPQDICKVNLVFCCWVYEDLGQGQQQMIELRMDTYDLDSVQGSVPVKLAGRPPVQWKLFALRTFCAQHKSPSSGQVYHDIGLSLTLQRQSGYYFWKARVPLLSTIILQALVFPVRPFTEEGASLRMSSCLAVFFAIVAIQLTIVGSVPKANVLHKLDRFTLTLLTFVVLVMLESSCLHYIVTNFKDVLTIEEAEVVDIISAMVFILFFLAGNAAIEIWAIRCNTGKSKGEPLVFHSLTLNVISAMDWCMNANGQLKEVLPSSLGGLRISKSTNIDRI